MAIKFPILNSTAATKRIKELATAQCSKVQQDSPEIGNKTNLEEYMNELEKMQKYAVVGGAQNTIDQEIESCRNLAQLLDHYLLTSKTIEEFQENAIALGNRADTPLPVGASLIYDYSMNVAEQQFVIETQMPNSQPQTERAPQQPFGFNFGMFQPEASNLTDANIVTNKLGENYLTDLEAVKEPNIPETHTVNPQELEGDYLTSALAEPIANGVDPAAEYESIILSPELDTVAGVDTLKKREGVPSEIKVEPLTPPAIDDENLPTTGSAPQQMTNTPYDWQADQTMNIAPNQVLKTQEAHDNQIAMDLSNKTPDAPSSNMSEKTIGDQMEIDFQANESAKPLEQLQMYLADEINPSVEQTLEATLEDSQGQLQMFAKDETEPNLDDDLGH